MTGLRSYRSGKAAETSVERHYVASGATVLDRRWRSSAGEIDLVLKIGAQIVFVEVKQARDHRSAASRLSEAQCARIFAAASEFLAGTPNGQDTDCRFDVALVDATGQIEILENAFP